jgi:hypothetical protein
MTLAEVPLADQFDTTFDAAPLGAIEAQFNNKEAQQLAAQARRIELQDYHVISQVHRLPFPYLSQIYHLLNLKHLETVHNMSLGNLRIIDVSSFQPTLLGGSIKFKTILDSSLNLLKIWRNPIADVQLILHTPHMIELNVPVYGKRRMVVIFSVKPLSQNSHQLSIDIYTDLKFPRFFLYFALHIASFITLYEDLPYLEKLSNRGFDHLLNSEKVSGHKSMGLFKRFVDLYAAELQPVPELQPGA